MLEMERDKKNRKVVTLEVDNGTVIGTSGSVGKNKKLSKALKVILLNDDSKFLSNFDPERSNRERRKLSRKFNVDGKRNCSESDESGVFGGAERDVCDCLIEGCPGCHFPCPKCRSHKCGLECRVNRKWSHEEIEDESILVINRNTKVS